VPGVSERAVVAAILVLLSIEIILNETEVRV
jgi:hypothetical protein